MPAPDRNLLRLTFTDPYVRGMLPDWEVTVRSFLADYRAEAGSHTDRAAHVQLITRLRRDSEDFARAWDDHEVRRFASRARTFLHPAAGRLDFEQHQLVPSDAPRSTSSRTCPRPDLTPVRGWPSSSRTGRPADWGPAVARRLRSV